MKLKALALAALALAFSASTNAATFEYSYTYNNGTRISGTLTGSLIGDFVQNVSDISVFANGVPLTGRPYYLGGLIPEDGGFSNFGGRLSPIQSLNRFVFTDSPNLNEFRQTSFFDFDGNLSTGNFGSNSHYGRSLPGEFFARVLAADRPVNNSFSLVETTLAVSPVPEPSTYAMLLTGLVVVSISYMRRNSEKNDAA
jgi:hypothetical protein